MGCKKIEGSVGDGVCILKQGKKCKGFLMSLLILKAFVSVILNSFQKV